MPRRSSSTTRPAAKKRAARPAKKGVPKKHGTGDRQRARRGTVSAFAETLAPEWTFPDDWADWPPDLFAFTSAVFERTGCYRDVIRPDELRGDEWQRYIEKTGDAWLAWVNERLRADRSSDLAKPESVQTLLDDLREQAGSVSMEELRTLTPRAVDLTRTLLKLHAIADEACSSVGSPIYAGATVALAHCAANLLLTSTGSLSVLPKHVGIVLPKMRTPQKGLTLRSLSLYLSFHTTEVEVMWRTMPWPNMQENTINVLAIPWPVRVGSSDFVEQPDTFESVRYFRVERDPLERLPCRRIVELLDRLEEKRGIRIHVIVLPESSISEEDYKALLAELREARGSRKLRWMPLVLAGVSKDAAPSAQRDTATDHLNELRLAAYFAGRWYSLAQLKHHRWKLDAGQIRQYELDGHLPTHRDWFEQIRLGQRRLTFLAPNGWLTLCPLICEDLAQLEPVSELIRGVGPTLLLALLADGPQLETRWSARYASVFADDPGTAVFTLTSLGMARRSKRFAGAGSLPQPSMSSVVGLWRDLYGGWKHVDVAMPDGSLPEDVPAAVLTLSADWRREYSADGRQDHKNAATFRVDGIKVVTLPVMDDDAPTSDPGYSMDEPVFAHWSDIRELTAGIFAMHSALYLYYSNPGDAELVIHWLLALDDAHAAVRQAQTPRLGALIRRIQAAQRTPQEFGISWEEPRGYDWSADIEPVVSYFREMANSVAAKRGDYLKNITDEAIRRLDAERSDGRVERRPWDQRMRLRVAVCLTVLAAVHTQLEQLKRPSALAHLSDERRADPELWKLAPGLLQQIEDALDEYS